MRPWHRVLVLVLPLAGCGGAPPGGPVPLAHLSRLAFTALADAPAEAASNALPIVSADVGARTGLALTIYQGGLARVEDARQATLPAGKAVLRFPGVSGQTDAGSLVLRAVGGGRGPTVLEQSFAPATLTSAKVLQAYVGKTISVRFRAEGNQPARVVTGTLLGVEGGPVIRIGDQVYLQPPGDLLVPDVPKDLVALPQLSWQLDDPVGGARTLEAGYLTGGLSWSTVYDLTLAPDGNTAALAAWATLANQTNADFPDARVSVVAGRLAAAPHRFYAAPAPAAAPMEMAGGGGFTEHPMDEFHRYDLAGTVQLPAGETRQMALFSASAVPITRKYRFESSPGENDEQGRAVAVRLEFTNDQASGLGVPMPGGGVHIYGPRGAGATSLVGEGSIANTPTDERIKLAMGSAFDLVGEHHQTRTRQIDDRTREEAYTVVLRNHKTAPVTVDVVEHPSGDWQVTEKSLDYVATSATEIVFSPVVPAGGETRLAYTVRIKTPKP